MFVKVWLSAGVCLCVCVRVAGQGAAQSPALTEAEAAASNAAVMHQVPGLQHSLAAVRRQLFAVPQLLPSASCERGH